MSKKPRDQRKRVLVAADLVDAGRHSRVTILNVSRRGLMASCIEPPLRGCYVEIRKGPHVIVGRVVWSGKLAFGLRTQDYIDTEGLAGVRLDCCGKGAKARRNQLAARRLLGGGSPDSYERSRLIGSRMTFVAGVLAAIAMAAVSGALLLELLSASFNPLVGKLSDRD